MESSEEFRWFAAVKTLRKWKDKSQLIWARKVDPVLLRRTVQELQKSSARENICAPNQQDNLENYELSIIYY